ncbi:MAG: hypothetical protein ACOYXM_17825 [Actinomycetota bacterium]
MTKSTAATPDPQRAALARSIMRISPLKSVAMAVSVATEHERRVYIERMAGGWRWSPVHPGGGYPLLRITARFLQIDYHHLRVPFRTLDDDNTIVCRNPDRPSRPKAWALIDFDGPATPDEVEIRIRQTLDAPRREPPA